MDMQRCIDDCLACLRVCMETVPHCLKKGGPHADAAHIRLLLDRAEICKTSAAFMMRGSDLHTRTCGVCAEICQLCADDCERLADDPEMRRCAELCRRCAKSCRQIIMAVA